MHHNISEGRSMKITKRQLKRIIREEYARVINEAIMVDRPDQMSGVSDKLSVIDQYDQQRNEWLAQNGTSRSGRKLKKYSSQERNGLAMSKTARVYLQDFEPRIAVLKAELDSAVSAGDQEKIGGFKGLAAQMRKLIYHDDAGLESVVGGTRFGKGGILASISKAIARNKRILDVDEGLRNELYQIQQFLQMLLRFSESKMTKREIRNQDFYGGEVP